MSRPGLFRRVLDDDGFISGVEWMRHVSEWLSVGECECGGMYAGRVPERIGSRTWYAASCGSCGHEMTAPDGRTLPGSSARGGMRSGGWQARERALKNQA